MSAAVERLMLIGMAAVGLLITLITLFLGAVYGLLARRVRRRRKRLAELGPGSATPDG